MKHTNHQYTDLGGEPETFNYAACRRIGNETEGRSRTPETAGRSVPSKAPVLSVSLTFGSNGILVPSFRMWPLFETANWVSYVTSSNSASWCRGRNCLAHALEDASTRSASECRHFCVSQKMPSQENAILVVGAADQDVQGFRELPCQVASCYSRDHAAGH